MVNFVVRGIEGLGMKLDRYLVLLFGAAPTALAQTHTTITNASTNSSANDATTNTVGDIGYFLFPFILVFFLFACVACATRNSKCCSSESDGALEDGDYAPSIGYPSIQNNSEEAGGDSQEMHVNSNHMNVMRYTNHVISFFENIHKETLKSKQTSEKSNYGTTPLVK